MLKKSFIVILFLVCICSASAGGFDNRRLGVEGSWTWNMGGFDKIETEDDLFTYGGNLGVCYKLKNRYGWFFEPTLSFSFGDYEFCSSDAVHKASLTAIEVPVKFGHDFKLPVLDMTVSPLIAVKPIFALGGHLTLDGVRYPWNRFNIAGCFGFGLLVDDKFGINIRGDINLLKSIHNLPQNSGIINHSGMVNIALKYYF